MGFGIKKAWKSVKKAAKKVVKTGVDVTEGLAKASVLDVGGAIDSYSSALGVDSLLDGPPKLDAAGIPVMPDVDAEAVARARRRAAAQAAKGGGRSSTVLTGGGGTTLIG